MRLYTPRVKYDKCTAASIMQTELFPAWRSKVCTGTAPSRHHKPHVCRQGQFHSSILLRFKNESYLRFDSLACRRLRVEASTQCRDMVPADSLWTQKEAPKTNSTVKEIECTKRLDLMVYTLYGPRYGMVVTVQRAQECYAAARSTTTLRARGL